MLDQASAGLKRLDTTQLEAALVQQYCFMLSCCIIELSLICSFCGLLLGSGRKAAANAGSRTAVQAAGWQVRNPR